ncbi:hypothetical protein L5515_016759 [Caenorhabditis briggsae]|uniref:Uncharacterized protein n=1 Tax=Caenorhabditis briggsae TaxID=6238 RepID=A0AAE9FFC6_CAEBR|nr:hypothetical protein L3Y34_010875 [Caenorhabditis briggsae]UMM39910.1 hypothetical protein L5515_016759 [Caenorhabditis briggsae]
MAPIVVKKRSSSAHANQPTKSKRSSRDDNSNGYSGYEDATPRPSIDFPTAVIEAARRASLLGRTTADTLLSAPEAASSSDRGEHTNSRSPSTSYSSCIDDERKFSSPHRRRVVDVSDHKTCALLMTRMKEASRQLPSPNQ